MKRRTGLLKLACLISLGVVVGGVAVWHVSGSDEAEALNYKKYQRIDFTFEPTLKLNVSGDLTIDNLSLGTNGDSNIISVETGTNVPTGMLLTATVGSSSSPYNTTGLVNGSNSFAALTGSAASLDSSDFGANRWGYSYCVENCSTNSGVWRSGDIDSVSVTTGYAGLPLYNDVNPLKLVNTSDITDETLHFKIGAKASGAQASGEYTNVINFVAVTNVVATEYTLAYIDESNQASGMPTSITNPVAVSGPVAISASMPSRLSYIFEGWCTMQLSNGDCPGNVYQPGESYPVSEVGGAVAINLYAIWRSKCEGVIDLYGLVACRNKGTQTAANLQASITTTNSGVYEYNSSLFGASSDASNKYPIYYYRGILDSSFTDDTNKYGSGGDGVLTPNYVRLGTGNTATCWRIVRTTGSGGVKMVYNGVWGDTAENSCANDTAAAQIRSTGAIVAGNAGTFTSAFAGTAAAQYRSIAGVGYTRNNTYASTSAINPTVIGTIFGSNSNYSGNSTNSTIKGNIETWYNNNLSSYTNILETSAGYCNDRSLYPNGSYGSKNVLSESTEVVPYGTSGMDIYYFGAYARNMNSAQLPSLTCPRNVVDLYSVNGASTGNGQLSKPVALLTADEMSFAGSGNSGSNGSVYSGSSYLRSGSSFWLLSPYFRVSDGRAGGFTLYSGGVLYGSSVSSSYGVRPAISLSYGTNISSGSGTAADPWVINAPTPSSEP